MENDIISKAKILMEALPYIKEFNGITVVIKYGGSALINEEIKSTLIEDIALMKYVGFRPIVVHGGGPDINQMLDKLGIVSSFVNGMRVTDAQTMEVVEMVLAGKLNKAITFQLNTHGINAVGICGKDGGMLRSQKLSGVDLGLVGEVEQVDIKLINVLMENDFVPVIAPIGFDSSGNTYNINADYAAVAVAGALNAEKLVFLTDVEGVRANAEDSRSVISRITVDRIREMIEDKSISGGMIPKVECCIEAVNAGVKHVHILDGRLEHSLILEIFTNEGIGTLIHS